MEQQLLGYGGSLVAVLFYGSNYVVTKKFPTGDGFFFSWILSCGILIVGFVTMFLTRQFQFFPYGIIGGTIWAMGNLMVPKIVQWVGLGVGFLLWSGSNLITGYFVGKLGLFGLPREQISGLIFQLLNIAGIFCGFVSLGPYFFIRPSLESDKKKEIPLALPLALEKEKESPEEINPVDENSHSESINLIATPQNRKTDWLQIAKRALGMAMALTSGVLYGVNLVPFKLWYNSLSPQDKDTLLAPLGFGFSYFCGIWLFTTGAFLLYCSVMRNSPQLFSTTLLPAIASGIMWAIASCGLFFSVAFLGFTVGYPIVGIGPTLVSSFWSVIVFREIRGVRNLILLAVSLSIIILAIFLLTVSHLG